MRVMIELNVPESFKVGDAVIGLEDDDVYRDSIAYQGWLNTVDSEAWGNVNVAVDPLTLEYNAWLDYGPNQDDDGVEVWIRGKLKALTSAEMTKEIGVKILRKYPYKDTISPFRNMRR